MSKEVTGSAAGAVRPSGGAAVDLDDPTVPEEPTPPRSRLHRFGPTTATVLAVLALAGVGLARTGAPADPPPPGASSPRPTSPSSPSSPSSSSSSGPAPGAAGPAAGLFADLPVDAGLFARVRPAGREGGDLDHVSAVVELTNRGGVTRRVVDVDLLGLGTATLAAPPAAPLAPQRAVALTATVSADCGVRDADGIQVRVIELDPQGRRFEVRATVLDRDSVLDVLDPLCPRYRTGLQVAVVATAGSGDGVATVRIVNHGNLSALVTPRAAPDAGGLRLVSAPPLPYDLGPGQAVVATLDLEAAPGTDGCPAAPTRQAAAALYLEAETPYVFSEVTGFPQAALEAAVERLRTERGCPGPR